MKRYLRGVLAAAVLLGAGAAVSEPKQDAINLRIAREQYNLRMTPDSVTGQDFQVSRLKNGLRGRTWTGVVDVTFKNGTVKGALAGAVVNLDVRREGDTLVAEGGFGGRPANVKMTPDEVTVYVRDCTYRLKAREPGRSYAGKRSCDTSLVPESELWLPDEFLAASPEEKATLLLLAL
ncbi:hypothetical protein NVS55_01820 [Myxococcus stipitatus]|uniref:hypothetical protein n=1 Tax=Myxococcus stipitatus TaxID=83455 RepID=UPI003145236A